MKPRIILQVAALLALLMLLSARAQFAGGSGTPADPYRIETAAQLNAMHTNLTAHFQQIADIDLGVAPWNEGSGWVPIGTSAAHFTGTYDGAGFTIRNLTVNRPSTGYQGLFGYLNQATVRNLRLHGVSVRGGGSTGGLAGRADYSTLDNISIIGEVAGAGYYTGGVLGYMDDGGLACVSASVSVLGADYTGGVVGKTSGKAIIRHAALSGSVQGNSYVGGLIGTHTSDSSYDRAEIADSYSRAAVSGNSNVGGFVGYALYSRVYRSYSSGAVSGGSKVGGFLGSADTGATVAGCYWDTETSGKA
ncbi:MAG: GLUG motif-containing protein, partial [Kiritimatiellae bacterium]|nr:GLUG motif-containing protein [Kiritimatiellia bacterium]